MRKFITLLSIFVLSLLKSQTYQLDYQCKRSFNDQEYKLIQKFDKEKYNYTVERIIGFNSPKSFHANVILDPQTLSYETVKFPEGKEAFYSDLMIYNSIVKEADFHLDVIFIPQENIQNKELRFTGKQQKIKVREYLIKDKTKDKNLYKAYVIEEDLLAFPMVYSKKHLLSEWTTVFYAYKNSNMNRIIYSFEELTSDPYQAIKCSLTQIKEIDGL